MSKKKLLRLLAFYALYLLFSKISKSVLPTHIFKQGLIINQMLLGKAIVYVGQLLLLLILTKFSAKKSWKLALLFTALSVALVIKIKTFPQFLLASLFSGFSLYFFFIFYNIAHFRYTPQEKTGYSSGIMFAIGPIISVVAPLIAGFIASININYLWLASGLTLAAAYFGAVKQTNFKINYQIKSALQEIKATRFFIFIEGIWEAVIIGIIPIYTLKFISTPLEYGQYLSYLSLLGVVASLSLGKLTDKLQKRSVFLYPITILMSVFTFVLVYAKNTIIPWIIITGGIQLLLPVFWNISTALVVDKHQNLELAIPGREIALASGRLLGLLVTYFGFTLEKTPHYILILLSLVFLLFPLNLFYQTQVTKNHQFL